MAPKIFVKILVVLIVSELAVADPVGAYVDPGTTGLLSQILYVLFYGALGLFFYCLKYIKQHLISAKQFLARHFKRES
jgi:hypothetical protein